MNMINGNSINITKQLSFIEYLGDNLSLDSLDNNVKSEISTIFTVGEDGDHYVYYQPSGIFNSLTSLE